MRAQPRPLFFHGQPVEAVIFNLDGTLVDSELELRRNVAGAFRHLGVTIDPARLHQITAGAPRMADILASVMPDATPGVLAEFIAEADRIGRVEGPLGELYPGTRDVLIALRARGVRLAVATGRSSENADRFLRERGIRELFDSVLGTAETSIPAKPSPRLLQITFGRLGIVPARVVMVGDLPNDVLAGQAAGIRTIGAAYGYGVRRGLGQTGATAMIQSVPELLRVLGLRVRRRRASVRHYVSLTPV